jgi:Tfp pilus assembly protein PilV
MTDAMSTRALKPEARGPRPEAGFTLIEVMIAILLTVIAVMGIVGLVRAEARSGNRARHMTEASVLAAGKMEEMRTITMTAAGSGVDATAVDSRGVAGGIYTRSWSWTPGTITNTYTYTVTVSWSEDGTATSVTMNGVRGS